MTAVASDQGALVGVKVGVGKVVRVGAGVAVAADEGVPVPRVSSGGEGVNAGALVKVAGAAAGCSPGSRLHAAKTHARLKTTPAKRRHLFLIISFTIIYFRINSLILLAIREYNK